MGEEGGSGVEGLEEFRVLYKLLVVWVGSRQRADSQGGDPRRKVG